MLIVRVFWTTNLTILMRMVPVGGPVIYLPDKLKPNTEIYFPRVRSM